MALTYDQITAITRKFYMPKMPELVFNRNFLQMRLAKKGTKPSSGEKIMQPIMYQISKGSFYTPYQIFDISAEDQITAAEYNWKYCEVPITISRDEILKNDGPEGVKKLLDAKMKLAGKKMSDLLAVSMFSTGGDSASGLNGLDNLLNDASDTLGGGTTAGGIDKATYSWWEATLYDGSAADPGKSVMGSAWFAVVDGDDQPTIIIGHNNALQKLWDEQQAQQRYLKQDLLDMGFTAMEFNGKPYVGDLHVADSSTDANNRLYMINEDYIDFVTHSKENMRLEPFAKPINQAVIVAHIMFAGNLTVSYPKRHCVIHNFNTV